MFQVRQAALVIAYLDGSPAHVHMLDEDLLEVQLSSLNVNLHKQNFPLFLN